MYALHTLHFEITCLWNLSKLLSKNIFCSGTLTYFCACHPHPPSLLIVSDVHDSFVPPKCCQNVPSNARLILYGQDTIKWIARYTDTISGLLFLQLGQCNLNIFERRWHLLVFFYLSCEVDSMVVGTTCTESDQNNDMAVNRSCNLQCHNPKFYIL